MKNAPHTLALAAGCALTFAPLFAHAQDWPQWRGANRDAKVAGFTAPKTWPPQLTQAWKVTVGSADATPALVGDKLFVFSRESNIEVTRCLNAATGAEIWIEKYHTDDVSGADSAHPGPRSSPTVADGKVVTLGVTGILSCLDAEKGKLLWRKDDFPNVPRFHTSMSPLVLNGLCIAHLGGPQDGAVVAYDLGSGAEKWKWTGDGPSYSSPVLMEVSGAKLLIIQTDKNMMAINAADGKQVWQAPFAPRGMGYNAATPVVDGQTVYYAGQGRGTIAVKIEKQGDAFAAKELWTNNDLSPQFNSPILKNGHLYGLTQRGNFICVNAADGKTAWTDATGGRGAYGSIVDAGSVLLALTPKSQLIVFEPSEKQYTEVASIKVADKQVYAYPVVSGNRLFVEDQDSVTLWTIQ